MLHEFVMFCLVSIAAFAIVLPWSLGVFALIVSMIDAHQSALHRQGETEDDIERGSRYAEIKSPRRE